MAIDKIIISHIAKYEKYENFLMLKIFCTHINCVVTSKNNFFVI